jgi:hypothetical protein
MIMRIFAAVLLTLHLLSAQKLSHPLHAEAPERAVRTAVSASFPDTVKVLAIMVQFQTDNDSRTSGTGRFDLSVPTERIIDAPPHDSAYVADHFTFANNYFSKSSNGKQYVAATVLGNVITLKKQMKDYAPVNGNLPLAKLIEEAWAAADSLYPSFPFGQYELFAVFHAGVGRDIDLRSAIGYDPTPLDIPSLYFSLPALKTLFGPTFTGITLKNSSFKIPNTVVLPETEVRRIEGVGGDVVLKLGINGLIAASIGSHLGLPDLFDTKTGKSAIGRFGLMDGQSIFSYYGAAPPEPSAWEKMYLGWTTPIELTGTSTVNAPAVGLHATGNDTVYKVPISAKEYFLIENRHRDTKLDGQKVTMRWKGQIVQPVFSQDSSYFSSNGIDSLYGTVLDVDEPDWSLPGLINANNSYKGGILIWHIDETVIEKNLASNAINADPEHRGVDVEEADGSQDIGKSYDFGDPASGSEDGSPIDYWFSGNIFPRYTNEFSETTMPNALSNTYARSHITIKNFSVQSPRMTFTANVGSTSVQLLSVKKRTNRTSGNNDAPTAIDLNGDGMKELVYTSGDSIYALKNDLTPYFNNPTGLFSRFGGRYQPAPLWIVSRSENALVGVQDNMFYVFSTVDANADGAADTIFTAMHSAPFTTPPSTYTAQIGQSHAVVGDASGKRVNYYNITPTVWKKDTVQNHYSAIRGLSLASHYVTVSDDTAAYLSQKVGFGGASIKAFTSRGTNMNYVILSDNTFGAFPFSSSSSSMTRYPVTGNVTGAFALCDVNADGRFDYLIGADDKLYAYNENGTVIENFPFKTQDGGSVTGSPVIAQKKNSSELLIFFGSTNGHLYAVDVNGKIAPGFPLQTGGIASSPVLWNDKLSVASTDSSILTWNIGSLIDTSKIVWGGFLADPSHSNYVDRTLSPNPKSIELLPKKFAYNWPNPVYSGSTKIRYFLGKAATVTITIVNMAGELVQKLNGTGFAGMDNEVEWNITNVQSGIYFAQITAGGGGEEMSQIVKIAVVK